MTARAYSGVQGRWCTVACLDCDTVDLPVAKPNSLLPHKIHRYQTTSIPRIRPPEAASTEMELRLTEQDDAGTVLATYVLSESSTENTARIDIIVRGLGLVVAMGPRTL